MTFKVAIADSVAAEVATFSATTLHYWEACLIEIASDPFPRLGRLVERVIPVRPLPMRTYLYEIGEETSISGEQLFVFVAEFFPEYAIVYAVSDDKVGVFFLRPTK